MCGIFAHLTHPAGLAERPRHSVLATSCARTAHRGPDESRLEVEGGALSRQENSSRPLLVLGFHRLAINGLDAISGQPMRRGGCTLLCNGEIYNTLELQRSHGVRCNTGSDCEVVLALYEKYGMEQTLRLLDGVFALVLHDSERGVLHVARDLLGIRPLFVGFCAGGSLAFASEAKSLPFARRTEQFAPNSHWELNMLAWRAGDGARITNAADMFLKPIHAEFYPKALAAPADAPLPGGTLVRLRRLLHAAVAKRLALSERPVACLLSGGLDSSLVTAIAVRERRVLDPDAKPISTYAIGMPGSVDLACARQVAEFLGTDHHEVVVSEADFLRAVPETVWHTETHDITTVRASVGNYLVSRHIAATSPNRVVFVGDVADEAFASYRGFARAPSDEALRDANVAMLREIHFYDVLRSDRSISGAGLEARVPFADAEFLRFVMHKLPAGSGKRFKAGKMEKHVLRRAFEGYLPEKLLWRRKEAFSDGVASEDRGWHTAIAEHVHELYRDEVFEARKQKKEPGRPDLCSKEQLWYWDIYRSRFRNIARPVPHVWRHPFAETPDEDPSARTLDCY